MSKWIEIQEKINGNGLYRFQKRFSHQGKLSLRLSASTRYKLYINGKYMCEGPC